jgi:hypothetical protein
MKELLNEELLRQIRLMNFDRSKTLLEQGETPLPYNPSKPIRPSNLNLGNRYEGEIDCATQDGFKDNYPSCCKYKEIAVDPPQGSEFIPYDEKKNVGYCYYKDGRGYWITVPNDATLLLSNTKVRTNMVLALIEKFKKIDPGTTDFWSNLTKLNFLIQTKMNEGMSYLDAREESLPEYLGEVMAKQFPDESIVKITLSSSRDYSPSLKEIMGDLIFEAYYDPEGNTYEMVKFEDIRTGYEKFVDEWGTIVTIGLAIITMVVTAGQAAPFWAIYTAYALEGAAGLALAYREWERGEKIQAFFTVLFTALPYLQLSGAFRGATKELCDRALLALKNSGLSEASTEVDYIKFLTKINESDPEVAKLIKQAVEMDELTRATLQKQLPDVYQRLAFREMKEALSKSPDLIKSIKFWKSYVGKTLKYTGGLMVVNFFASILLGRYLDDEEKQKLSKLQTIIPEKHQEEFYFNIANNPDLIDELYKNKKIQLVERAKGKINEDKIIELCKLGQKEALTQNNREYVSLTPETETEEILKTNDWLEKNGYRKMLDSDTEFTDVMISDTDNSMWIK